MECLISRSYALSFSTIAIYGSMPQPLSRSAFTESTPASICTHSGWNDNRLLARNSVASPLGSMSAACVQAGACSAHPAQAGPGSAAQRGAAEAGRPHLQRPVTAGTQRHGMGEAVSPSCAGLPATQRATHDDGPLNRPLGTELRSEPRPILPQGQAATTPTLSCACSIRCAAG